MNKKFDLQLSSQIRQYQFENSTKKYGITNFLIIRF